MKVNSKSEFFIQKRSFYKLSIRVHTNRQFILNDASRRLKNIDILVNVYSCE